MRIADIHAHVFPDQLAQHVADNFEIYYETKMSHVPYLHTYLDEIRSDDFCCGIICSSATKPEQAASINRFIAQCAASSPKLLGLGSLYPTMENWEEELERIPALGLRGLKIHPDFQCVNIDEPKAIPMYRAIAAMGLPVLFHVGDPVKDYSSPSRLVNLLRQVPDLTVIAAHFGGWRAWQLPKITQFPDNIYFDCSSTLMYLGKEQGQDLMERLGPERFLFGSDFPYWTPQKELERFMELDLDEYTREKILYGNFETIFLKQE